MTTSTTTVPPCGAPTSAGAGTPAMGAPTFGVLGPFADAGAMTAAGVSLGDNVFRRYGYLAGTDEERLADLNNALRDTSVRAIVATRGGKGAYRIADQLDFIAARNDPKFLVGFSDITILHMSLWRHSKVVGLHGALYVDETSDTEPHLRGDSLRAALMTPGPTTIASREDELTSQLTTSGTVRGPLLGGNLDIVAAGAGWALPALHGAILFLEAVDLYLGQVDRHLTMLRKAGHLDGVNGVAIGPFTNFKPSKGVTPSSACCVTTFRAWTRQFLAGCRWVTATTPQPCH